MNSIRSPFQRSSSSAPSAGALGWILHPFRRQHTCLPDAAQVAHMVEEVESRPILQRWLLAAADQSPRARRALLARAAAVFRKDAQYDAVQIIEDLGEELLLEAVVAVLVSREGSEESFLAMAPRAQAKFRELSELLESREVACAG